MEYAIAAGPSGTVVSLEFAAGETAFEGDILAWLMPDDASEAEQEEISAADLDAIRPALAEVLARRDALLDHSRPDAVARRRKTGQRTARENIEDLCDQGSFVEYGGLAVAAQRSRRSVEELMRISPADGMVTGLATINADLFGADHARCAVLSYDYSVFAGTQGVVNHRKTDRVLGTGGQVAATGRALRRGRWRPARRRLAHTGRTRHRDVHPHRRTQRAGAHGRHRLGPLLRRQCRAARRLRPDHRHREREHRHGWSGHDRGRRARHLPAGGSRSDGRAGAQRRGRCAGPRRGRSRRSGQEVPVVFSGRRSGSAPTSGC